jgi:hypothetical protein
MPAHDEYEFILADRLRDDIGPKPSAFPHQRAGLEIVASHLFRGTHYDLLPSAVLHYEGGGPAWRPIAAGFLDRRGTRIDSPAGTNRSVLEITPRCFLAADGQHLYWLANGFRKLKEKDRNIELSVATTFRAWQTGPAGEERVQIAEKSFGPCDCGTRVCEETCPGGEFRAPAGGIQDFFFVTRWIPGQVAALAGG